MSKAVGAKGSNRRRFIRVEPDPFAPVRVDINGEGFIEVVKAVDISEGGIRIKVPHRFDGCHIEKPVSFIILLPAPINKHFSVEGHIKHVLNDSFGVRFTNLKGESRVLVRRYVALWLREHNGWWDYLRYKMGLMR